MAAAKRPSVLGAVVPKKFNQTINRRESVLAAPEETGPTEEELAEQREKAKIIGLDISN